jgi:hypothetical protein
VLARVDSTRKADLFRGFNPEEQARAFQAMSPAERFDLVGRAPQVAADLFGRLDARAKMSFYALATAAERQDAIGRCDIFGRSMLTAQARPDELARMQERMQSRVETGRGEQQGRQQQ